MNEELYYTRITKNDLSYSRGKYDGTPYVLNRTGLVKAGMMS